MKFNMYRRFIALGTAAALATALAGCGATASSAATSEAASSEAASSEAATDTATGEDAYAKYADFDYSSAFDDNGYLKDVKALDYVTLPEDFDKLDLPVGTDKLADNAVSDYIQNNILSSYTTTNQVKDRAAADGDTVNIDYVGSVDGVEFDGGNTQGNGADLELGSGSYIPGFEEQIVGHMPGETFDVSVTFPEDYSTADLAGKAAVFATTLNYISEEVAPELTDDWVKTTLGTNLNVSTVADLEAYISENLLYSQESSAVYSALQSAASFETALPEVATDYAKNYFAYNLYQSAVQNGTDLATMLSAYGYSDMDSFLESAGSTLTSMTQQLLMTQAVAEAQELVCDDKALADNFQMIYGTDDSSSFTEHYGTNYVKSMVLSDLAIRSLISTATFNAPAAESTASSTAQ